MRTLFLVSLICLSLPAMADKKKTSPVADTKTHSCSASSHGKTGAHHSTSSSCDIGPLDTLAADMGEID